MKILHITHSIGQSAYGIKEVVINMAIAQIVEKQNVEIWTFDDKGIINRIESEHNELRGCIHSLRYISINNYRIPNRVPVIYDTEELIIHQHGIWTGASLAAKMVQSKYGGKRVVAPHGALEKIALRKSFLKKFVVGNLYERSLMNSADVMHATSQKEVCDFRDYGLNNKILLLPNGISNKWVEMKGSAERFREKYKIDKKYRLLLFMSRITPKKGLERLIRIWSKITYRDNWKLVIIGSDEAGYLKRIEKMIDDLNLHNSIIHIDSLYSQEKRDAFAASELFILPSLSEGSPMVILDSLGAGVPVITTDVTPWEILNKLNIGWWVENSENGLEKALREALCIDKLELANKGRLSCEYVQNNCLWDTIAKQSISIYKNLYL